MTVKTEPSRMPLPRNVLLAPKDAKSAPVLINVLDANRDYSSTTDIVSRNALMDLLPTPANVLLARTKSARNAVMMLTLARNATVLLSFSTKNVFLPALLELSLLKENAENATPDVMPVLLTRTVLNANTNSPLTTENAIPTALTVKSLLETNVSPALILTANNA